MEQRGGDIRGEGGKEEAKERERERDEAEEAIREGVTGGISSVDMWDLACGYVGRP